jgi:hypothetical protein
MNKGAFHVEISLEKVALQTFYESLIHRSEIYCSVVTAISELGDEYIRDVMMMFPYSSNSSPSSSPSSASALPYPLLLSQQQSPSIYSSSSSSASISLSLLTSSLSSSYSVLEKYLCGCSLYLQGLSLLTTFMKSIDKNAQNCLDVDQSMLKTVITALKEVTSSCHVVNCDRYLIYV